MIMIMIMNIPITICIKSIPQNSNTSFRPSWLFWYADKA